MFDEKTITIRLKTSNMAMILAVALALLLIGFASGSLSMTNHLNATSASSTGQQVAAENQPGIVETDDEEAVFWFLEMDRVYRLDRTTPAAIDVKDSDGLKWFLEMDRVIVPQ